MIIGQGEEIFMDDIVVNNLASQHISTAKRGFSRYTVNLLAESLERLSTPSPIDLWHVAVDELTIPKKII